MGGAVRRVLTDLQLVGLGAAVVYGARLIWPPIREAFYALFDADTDRFEDVDGLALPERRR